MCVKDTVGLADLPAREVYRCITYSPIVLREEIPIVSATHSVFQQYMSMCQTFLPRLMVCSIGWHTFRSDSRCVRVACEGYVCFLIGCTSSADPLI